VSFPARAPLPDAPDRLPQSHGAARSTDTIFVNPAEDQELGFLNGGGILSALASLVLESIGASGISIAYAKEGSVVCRASCGDHAPAVGTPLNLNSGIGAQCLREAKTVKCADTESDPRVNRAVCRQIGVRSILAVPLLVNSKVVGIAQAYYAEPHGFSEANVAELQQSARLFVSSLPLRSAAGISARITTAPPVPAESENVSHGSTIDEGREFPPASSQPTAASSPLSTDLAEDRVPISVEESQNVALALSEVATVVSQAACPPPEPETSQSVDELESRALPLFEPETVLPEPARLSLEPQTAGIEVAQASLAPGPMPARYAEASGLTSFAQVEEPVWWKRPTVAAVALSSVLALSWVIFHPSSRQLVPSRHTDTSAVENSEETSDSAISQMSFAQLHNRARSGNAQAQFALAKQYETGKGIDKNLTKAYSWYIVAAEAGNDSARNAIRPLTSKLTAAQIAAVRFEVARMYANGIGVRNRDPVAAYAWMILAEAAGDGRAKAEQKVLAASMHPQQVGEAQTRAASWLRARGYQTQ
jgi:TPR repeat protein